MKAGEFDLKDYMILPREALTIGQVLTFGIYFHMEANESLVMYNKVGDTLTEAAITKMFKIQEKNLRVHKKEYAGFLDSQKDKLRDAIKAGDLASPAAKAAAGSIMKGLNMNMADGAATPGEQSAKAGEMLKDMTKIVSDLILEFKKSPSVNTYEQILKSAETAKDPLTAHNYQVSGMSVLILMTVGCTGLDEMTDIGVAGLLHDLGMSGISTSLIQMHLDGEEVANASAKIIYMRHIENVFEMLEAKGRTISPGAKKIIELHHENMDGSGFKGLAGGQIYQPARVVRIADDLCIWLTSKTKPKTMPEALAHLKSCVGTSTKLPIYDHPMLDILSKVLK